MSVQLEAIAFNHDSSQATHDAINIRRNFNQPQELPEWRRDISVDPDDSVATYALNETHGNELTIRASFSRLDPQLTKVHIRAVPDIMLEPWTWQFFGAHPLSNPQWNTTSPVHLLGKVQEREVAFNNDGITQFELFQLPDAQIWRYGIGIHRVRWLWQYRRFLGEPWAPFARSRHKIYTVLNVPTLPWQQTWHPDNTQLPWVEVLDFACRWAAAAVTEASAAARITTAVYNLSPELIVYNCPNLGAPMYVVPDYSSPPHMFDCSAFLDRLQGEFGRGPFVNCSDCAAIISTFANSVGCDLWQSRMGIFAQGFSLNPILVIGSSRWALPCDWWPGFGMHEVAWEGACREDDVIYDACLAIDQDGNPYQSPHVPLLPTGIPFGRSGDGLYADCLVAPQDRLQCQPWPSTQQRRRLI